MRFLNGAGVALATLMLGCQQSVDLQEAAQSTQYWQDMQQQAQEGKFPGYVAALTQQAPFSRLQGAVQAQQYQVVLSGAPQADSWGYVQALAQSFQQGSPKIEQILLPHITEVAVDSQLNEVQYVEFLGYILSYMQQRLGQRFIVVLALSQLPCVQQFHSTTADKIWTQQEFEENLIDAVQSAISPNSGQILWLDDLPKDAVHVPFIKDIAPLQIDELSAVQLQNILSSYKGQLERRLSIELNDFLFEKLVRVVIAYNDDRADASRTGPLQLGVDVLQNWSQRSASNQSVNQTSQQRDLLTVLAGFFRANITAISQSAAWTYNNSIADFDEDFQKNRDLYRDYSPVNRSDLASLPENLYARIATDIAAMRSVLSGNSTNLPNLASYLAQSLTSINTNVSVFAALVNTQSGTNQQLAKQMIDALSGLSSKLNSVTHLLSDQYTALQSNIALLRRQTSLS
ncbi:MAG: hypothetical protein AAF310_02425 [Myxococcota bacterium]